MNKPRVNRYCIALLALLTGACTMAGLGDRMAAKKSEASDPVVATGLKDSELAVPAGYRNWPIFLSGVDKVEAKQIRDIYINPTGHKTKAGSPFPDGTVSVMELWKPKMTADGALQRSPEGKLIKDELSLVFVMGKSKGAGELVDPALRTGDWVYAGYQPDQKTPGGPPAVACRACHVPEAAKDWVFRYDEYFAKRDK